MNGAGVLGRWVLVLAALAASPALGEQLTDPDLHFSVTIPDGFVRDPAIMAARRDFAHAYRMRTKDEFGNLIIIERMRGTIGREKLNSSHLPKGAAGRLTTVRWKDFDLQAFEIPETAGDLSIINYNVQVPLKGEAIQLRVAGPGDRKAETLALTKQLLDSLEGESNWLASVPSALAESPNYGMVLLTCCAAVIIGGLALLWRIRRRARPGVLLGVAAVLYATSWILNPGKTREMLALVGSIRLVGFIGLAIGIIDGLRKLDPRRPKPKPPMAAP